MAKRRSRTRPGEWPDPPEPGSRARSGRLSGLAIERPTQRGDVDLAHGQHGLHGSSGALRVGIAQHLAHLARDNLPRHAVAILQPAAPPSRSTGIGQRVPEAVDLRLVVAVDDERNRLGEWELRTAV